MKPIDIENLDWNKGDGLLPAIVQHARTGRVLMLGFVNREALRQSQERNKAVFYSRTRDRLWMKGETSGHTLELESIEVDCDNDTLLMLAEPAGPTCHRGSASCFPQSRPFLDRLDNLVASRLEHLPDNSYTTKLAQAGVAATAQKVGEEGVELALAAVDEDTSRVSGEAADLLYHVIVLLQQRGLRLADVTTVLRQRHADSANDPGPH